MGLKSIWRSLVKGEHTAAPGSVPLPREEPLECVIREQKRNEHLQNLGMKRNKSFRKSIAKKFKKKDKTGDHVDAAGPVTSIDNKENHHARGDVRNIRATKNPINAAPAPTTQSEIQIETRTSIGARIEGGRKIEVIKVSEKKDPASLVGETQPLPAHITNDVPRSMDKLRRSIRHSIRKRKETAAPEMSKLQKWQLDEAAVRSGTCKFYVKYFGCCEVYESRGMQVCEAAVESLKEQRRRTVRGTMYVSGDSIRLVDDDTKAMVLDQTIEKVSFCAPDRNFDRGFSYICRDGTTRRWMCHGFFAVGDTGERLSHAVGCAFGICLENKQKREKMSVSVNYNDKEASFTRVGTFRAGTMTERLADPQAMKPSESPKLSIASDKSSEMSAGGGGADVANAVERPRPSDAMYQRQASFRGLGQLSGNTPFKRGGKGHTSLRINDLPSTRDRLVAGQSLCDSPILEDIELPPSNLETDTVSVITKSSQSSTKAIDLLTSDEPYCYSSELAGLHTGLSGASTPAMVGVDSCSNYSTSPPPGVLQPVKLQNVPETPEGSINPWDNVPDQPPKHHVTTISVTSNVPTSSLTSISSLQTSSADSWLNSLTSSLTQPPPLASNKPSNLVLNNLFDSSPSDHLTSMASVTSKLSVDVQENSTKSNGTSSGYNSPSSTNSGQSASNDLWQADVSKSILEDPFDAEWAAIATRNSDPSSDTNTPLSNTNPFLSQDPEPTASSVKAFELQL